jgi:glycosyltransferase involved in cell wall biosynthesis
MTLTNQRYPIVSIITVVFNGSKTLRATIESIVPHLGDNVEYIVIDGGSTDGTREIIKEYASYLTYWVSESDLGIYDAMNKGISQANGDFCLFVGSDDEIIPLGFKKAQSLMTEFSCVYYGQVLKDGKPVGCRINKLKILRDNIPHQAIFYPKSVYKNNFYRLQYKICADHEYNIRLIYSKIKFKYMDFSICKFGSHGVSSLNADLDFARDYFDIVKNNAGTAISLLLRISKLVKRILVKFKI